MTLRNFIKGLSIDNGFIELVYYKYDDLGIMLVPHHDRYDYVPKDIMEDLGKNFLDMNVISYKVYVDGEKLGKEINTKVVVQVKLTKNQTRLGSKKQKVGQIKK